jgi:hypothetical protein
VTEPILMVNARNPLDWTALLFKGKPVGQMSRDELINALIEALRERDEWRLRAIDYRDNPLLRE